MYIKSFIFNIHEKIVKKDSINLNLIINEPKVRDEFTNLFNFYNNKIHLNLKGEDDIKITDKIIVSFDINQVDKEESLIGELDSLLSKVQFQNTIWDRQERILKKIKYLVDYHYSIEGKKAPVAE